MGSCCEQRLPAFRTLTTGTLERIQEYHGMSLLKYYKDGANYRERFEWLDQEMVKYRQNSEIRRKFENDKKKIAGHYDNFHKPLLNQLRSVHDRRESVLESNLKEIEGMIDDLKETEESLKNAIREKTCKLEKEYTRWTVDDTVQWVSMINQSHFRAPNYRSFIRELVRMEIDGLQLGELDNKFALSAAGLKSNKDQAIIRREINRVTSKQCGGSEEPSQNICGICVDNTINTVMIPCGHQYHCITCTRKSTAHKMNCPICRQPVTRVLQTYMAGFSSR